MCGLGCSRTVTTYKAFVRDAPGLNPSRQGFMIVLITEATQTRQKTTATESSTKAPAPEQYLKFLDP